jgi:hypothetical protein
LADYCLEQAIEEMEVNGDVFCESYGSFSAIPFPSACAVLWAVISKLDCSHSEASVLFDTRASVSFVDLSFARRNCLPLSKLKHPIQCRVFNGTLAKSGTISFCWKGCIHFPSSSLSSQFPVSLFVPELASADIILGFPWLEKNQIFVGGSPCSLLYPIRLEFSTVSSSCDLPLEITQFSNVFVTDSLSCLPPH